MEPRPLIVISPFATTPRGAGKVIRKLEIYANLSALEVHSGEVYVGNLLGQSLASMRRVHARSLGYAEFLFSPRQFPDPVPENRWTETRQLDSAKTSNSMPRVATILDDFSSHIFAPEFRSLPLTPQNWRTVLGSKPDFVFMESAWRGHRGVWRGQLSDPRGPRGALRKMLVEFKEADVPIVFWNKEDPPSYTTFIRLAGWADLVFTTAEEMIPRYQADLGHSRIELLAFAVQPSIHYPASFDTRERNVVFGGTYYRHKHDERRQLIDAIVGGALEFQPDIYNRKPSRGAYRWPAPYRPFLRGALPYRELIEKQRHYKVGLNVNSVSDSSTMLSRRALELAATGTPFVSSPSPALENFLGDSAVVSSSAAETRERVSELLHDTKFRRRVSTNLVEAAHEHTAQKRVETVLDRLSSYWH